MSKRKWTTIVGEHADVVAPPPVDPGPKARGLYFEETGVGRDYVAIALALGLDPTPEILAGLRALAPRAAGDRIAVSPGLVEDDRPQVGAIGSSQQKPRRIKRPAEVWRWGK